MMGYNEVANQELNLGDPFKGGSRNKLRPLIPRPYFSPPNHDVHTSRPTNHLLSSPLNTTATTRHHYHNHNHNHNFGGGGAEEGKAEAVGTNQVMVSSRWNPTPEQLGALEELYRRGTRTPSADQIQHITSQLRRYGKIEGKNVFYWFQNHKARERQKRRRHLQRPTSSHSSGNAAGGNKIGIETEQKSCKWAPSSTNKESDPPIQLTETGAAKAETASTSSEYEWIHFHETPHQFQPYHKTHNNNNNNNNNNISSIKNLLLFGGERNATWQTENNTMVQTSSCSCCYPASVFPFSLSSSNPIDSSSSMLIPKDLNQSPGNPVVNGDDHGGDVGGGETKSPTLQLFPVAHIREDDQHNHTHNSPSLDYHIDDYYDDDDDDDDGMKKVEEEEKSEYINSNENANMHNNPFPYYQFL